MKQTDDLALKLKGIISDDALKILLGSEALTELLSIQKKLEEDLNCEKETTKYLRDCLHDEKRNIETLEKDISIKCEKLSNIDSREKIVVQKEFEQAVDKVRLSAETRRGDEFKELMHLTLRNPVIKNSFLERKDVAIDGTPAQSEIKDEYGNIMTYSQPPSGGYTETLTHESENREEEE